MNRIDRLTAILIQLQSKKVVKAEEIADRFEISQRTVYRDVKALMEAGVPIGSEAGKGYFIVDGYHLPPVVFTQEEASAMQTAGKLVEKMTDDSIRKAYESALLKIKAVLNDAEKDHLENLESSIQVLRLPDQNLAPPAPFMAEVTRAVSHRQVITINYVSGKTQEETTREVEPIGILYYSGRWHLIAWCRLRNGYRDFRIDVIRSLKPTNETFDPRSHYTLEEYMENIQRQHGEMTEVVVLFERNVSSYVRHSRYFYGFVSEEEMDNHVRMTFLVASMRYFCKWLLMYGKDVEIQSPEMAKEMMEELVEELASHYRTSVLG